MIRSRKNSHLRVSLALLLIGVMLANAGLQGMDANMPDPLGIDICDHTDSETECDKKGSGETDDIISHDVRSLTVFLNFHSIADNVYISGYLNHHTEIVCPPPEYHTQ
jgi:hypothetical protein